jgi:ubiquinone/menaquinone biosynthesis C-methylase UbiE
MSETNTWNRLAHKYDTTVRLFDRSYGRIRELLRSDLAGAERVLEIASGTGQFTFELAEAAGQLLATDLSAEMIARLDAKLADRDVANVSTAVMSAYDLGLDDGSVDAAFCANALHVMENPERALRELHRVIRPGGRLLVPTFCHGIDRRRRLLSRLLSLVSPFVAHTKLTPSLLVSMVEAAGFEPQEPIVLPGMLPIAYLVADRPA